MKLRKKWLGILCLCLAMTLSVPNIVWATDLQTNAVSEPTPEPTPTPLPIETNAIEGWAVGPETTARTACLMDANTGAVLYNKGMTERMYPASTTKVMTALLVLEHAQLDEVFAFTETGVAMAYGGSSNLITQVGEQFTVEDAVYALMLKSANDFAAQIAEYVGGTLENFVQMMNDKAAELGCVNTHFTNPHGMPDDDHYSCAYDLCLIMQEASKNEDFCRISSATHYQIPATHLTDARNIETHNGLIMEGESHYDGAIAGKTGYTDAAWCTYVSVAERNGMKLIEATMKAPNNPTSFADAAILYDYGFGSFQNLMVKETGDGYYGGLITVPNGVTVDAVTTTQGEAVDTILGTMVEETYSYHGHEVGSIAISYDYIAQIEAEEQAKIEQEEAEKQALAEKKEAEKKENEHKMEANFSLVLKIMIGLVVFGIVLIIVALIRRELWRRRRRRSYKRRKNKRKHFDED